MKPNYSPNTGVNRPNTSSFDAFSILSGPNSSNSNSRSATLANLNRTQGQQIRPTNQGGADAFSSLLGASFSSSSSTANMSLADKQAAALKERQAKLAQKQVVDAKEASVWSGLDLIGQSSVPLSGTNSTPSTNLHTNDEDWLFDKPTQKAAPQTSSNDPMSLIDSLDNSSISFSQSQPQPSANHSVDDGDDDILGMLGRPVESVPKQETPDRVNPPTSRVSKQTRPSSPPPHLIGQIVEMGFSPQQARLALASTDSGLDVQQALETLLANGVGSEERSEPELPPREHPHFQDSDDGWGERRGEREPPRRPSQSRQSSRSQTDPPSFVPNELQERADKLLAQASEIGFTMFTRANALWKDGREKVQKAYEERATKSKPINDGRPRWMSEIPPESSSHNRDIPQNGPGTFQDDGGDERIVPPQRKIVSDSEARKRMPQNPPHLYRTKEHNLFDDEPEVYVSPARRRPATTQPPQTSGSSSQTPPVPRRPSPIPALRVRQTVSASASAISASNSKKAKGTELFKLGQYANAADAYTSALSGLPENHLLTIPLYNNRALSRIKIGEHAGAVEDCTVVITIIGADYNPAQETKVTREDEGASVDLADALLKAFRRRAEAHEGREKWESALKDWEAIINCTWSSKMRSDAQSGAARCRKMLTVERDPPLRKTVPPRPAVAKSVPSKSNVDFEAVKKLRQANQEKEKEEEKKLSLKDSVDSRLNTWKAGKETNIRALVASLDTVLWPELGWQKIGMHELVTPSQVKVRYMKAIAKLHPDKLNSGNTTVEQRMIANGVFAALNDAWLAFKQ